MILLLIKEFDTTGKNVTENQFDRSWFRLSNEDTNQTLDYSLIKNIAKPDEYQPYLKNEEEDEENKSAPVRNDLTYIHGRLYLEENG